MGNYAGGKKLWVAELESGTAKDVTCLDSKQVRYYQDRNTFRGAVTYRILPMVSVIPTSSRPAGG